MGFLMEEPELEDGRVKLTAEEMEEAAMVGFRNELVCCGYSESRILSSKWNSVLREERIRNKHENQRWEKQTSNGRRKPTTSPTTSDATRPDGD